MAQASCGDEISAPAVDWLMRKTTNSAGLTGAIPMIAMTRPASMSSWVLVSSSHLTKNACSGVAPIRPPSRQTAVRNAPTSRRMCFHSVRSLGSKTIQFVPSAIDSSIMLNSRRTLR